MDELLVRATDAVAFLPRGLWEAEIARRFPC